MFARGVVLTVCFWAAAIVLAGSDSVAQDRLPPPPEPVPILPDWARPGIDYQSPAFREWNDRVAQRMREHYRFSPYIPPALENPYERAERQRDIEWRWPGFNEPPPPFYDPPPYRPSSPTRFGNDSDDGYQPPKVDLGWERDRIRDLEAQTRRIEDQQRREESRLRDELEEQRRQTERLENYLIRQRGFTRD